MAFNKAPNTWLSGWSENGTDITVPLDTFPELTADEADGANGDIRKVLFAVADKLHDAWNSTEAADRPTQMSITKSVSTNVSTGITTNIYTLRFYCGVSAQEVLDEPA